MIFSKKSLRALWFFCRPHAMVGTCLQAVIIYMLARNIVPQVELATASISLLAIVFLHIYAMGINQIYDLEIDKINKPFLPLASGQISLRQARQITYFSGATCLTLSLYSVPYLFATIGLLLFFTTTYSVPPWRFKENPVLSALSISISRSIVYVGGFLLTLTEGVALQNPSIVAMAFLGFCFVYAIVISFTKDIPDMEGDRRHGVKSIAVVYGPQRVLALGCILLVPLYVIMFFVPFFFDFGPFSTSFSLAQALQLAFLMAGYFYYIKLRESSKAYYLFLWKLLYFQYVIFFFVNL